jgi:hypothetical protein
MKLLLVCLSASILSGCNAHRMFTKATATEDQVISDYADCEERVPVGWDWNQQFTNQCMFEKGYTFTRN